MPISVLWLDVQVQIEVSVELRSDARARRDAHAFGADGTRVRRLGPDVHTAADGNVPVEAALQ